MNNKNLIVSILIGLILVFGIVNVYLFRNDENTSGTNIQEIDQNNQQSIISGNTSPIEEDSSGTVIVNGGVTQEQYQKNLILECESIIKDKNPEKTEYPFLTEAGLYLNYTEGLNFSVKKDNELAMLVEKKNSGELTKEYLESIVAGMEDKESTGYVAISDFLNNTSNCSASSDAIKCTETVETLSIIFNNTTLEEEELSFWNYANIYIYALRNDKDFKKIFDTLLLDSCKE